VLLILLLQVGNPDSKQRSKTKWTSETYVGKKWCTVTVWHNEIYHNGTGPYRVGILVNLTFKTQILALFCAEIWLSSAVITRWYSWFFMLYLNEEGKIISREHLLTWFQDGSYYGYRSAWNLSLCCTFHAPKVDFFDFVKEGVLWILIDQVRTVRNRDPSAPAGLLFFSSADNPDWTATWVTTQCERLWRRYEVHFLQAWLHLRRFQRNVALNSGLPGNDDSRGRSKSSSDGISCVWTNKLRAGPCLNWWEV
jgi:hypothetical protein